MNTQDQRHSSFKALRAFGALTAALLLISCGTEADVDDLQEEASAVKVRKPVASQPAPQPDPEPAATVVFTLTAPGETPVPVTDLDISSTPAVYIASHWTGVTSGQAQRVDVFKPSGLLYSSTLIPFDGTGHASVVLEPDGSYRVHFRLEIQGTPIETYAMTGTWRATVSLDGTRTQGPSTTVVLR